MAAASGSIHGSSGRAANEQQGVGSGDTIEVAACFLRAGMSSRDLQDMLEEHPQILALPPFHLDPKIASCMKLLEGAHGYRAAEHHCKPPQRALLIAAYSLHCSVPPVPILQVWLSQGMK